MVERIDFYDFIKIIKIRGDVCIDCKGDFSRLTCSHETCPSEQFYKVPSQVLDALADGIRKIGCDEYLIGVPRVVKIVMTSICWSNFPTGGKKFWDAYIFSAKTLAPIYKEEKYITYLVSPEFATSCIRLVSKYPIFIQSLKRSVISNDLKTNQRNFDVDHCSSCGARLKEKPRYYKPNGEEKVPVWVCPNCGRQYYHEGERK